MEKKKFSGKSSKVVGIYIFSIKIQKPLKIDELNGIKESLQNNGADIYANIYLSNSFIGKNSRYYLEDKKIDNLHEVSLYIATKYCRNIKKLFKREQITRELRNQKFNLNVGFERCEMTSAQWERVPFMMLRNFIERKNYRLVS